jgi:hypothetical protein
VSLIGNVQEGYLVLYIGSVVDDLVYFSLASAKLYSDDVARSQFAIIPAGANIFSMQDNGWPVVYIAGGATYNIYSDQPSDPAPVPGSLLLLGSGLVSLAGWRRFRKG